MHGCATKLILLAASLMNNTCSTTVNEWGCDALREPPYTPVVKASALGMHRAPGLRSQCGSQYLRGTSRKFYSIHMHMSIYVRACKKESVYSNVAMDSDQSAVTEKIRSERFCGTSKSRIAFSLHKFPHFFAYPATPNSSGMTGGSM